MAKFPVTPQEPVRPSDPKDEPTREYVNAHPEDLTMRVLRARRYFRLMRAAPKTRFAIGLDSLPEDFA